MDLPIPCWSKRSLRSAVVPKDDLLEPSSRCLNGKHRIPLEMPVPKFVSDSTHEPETIEISIIDEPLLPAIYRETPPKRPMCLPLPPWASESNFNEETLTSIAKTELQYPPRPSAPRRIYDTTDPLIAEPETPSIDFPKSRHQPILTKLLETTKFSQPLTFSRLQPSTKDQPELEARLSSTVPSVEAPTHPTKVQERQHVSESRRSRLRSASVTTAIQQTESSISGYRTRGRPQLHCLPKSSTNSPASRVREEPRTRRASQPSTLDDSRSQRPRTSTRTLRKTRDNTQSTLSQSERGLPRAPISLESTIPTQNGNSVPNRDLPNTRENSIATRSRYLAESIDGPESPLSFEGNSSNASSLRRIPDSRDAHQSPEIPSDDDEHLSRKARAAATIFPSGPAHSTRITYTMAPSNNSPTQHHWVTQQTQLLNRSSFTPPFFPCAQYSPRLSQSVGSVYPAEQLSSSPQQLTLTHPPRSREDFLPSMQTHPTGLTKIVQIKYAEPINQTQFAPSSQAYSDPKLRILIHPQQSDAPLCAYPTQQAPRFINLVPHVNIQHRTQVHYATPPTQFLLGNQHPSNLSPSTSSRVSHQGSSAQIFPNQTLNLTQPTVLSHPVEFLN